MMTASVDVAFNAAHRICSGGGRCGNLHGHTYRVRVDFACDRAGVWDADYKALRQLVYGVTDGMDYAVILSEDDPAFNDITQMCGRLGFKYTTITNETTPGNIASAVLCSLIMKLDEGNPEHVRIKSVTVWDSAETRAMVMPDTAGVFQPVHGEDKH